MVKCPFSMFLILFELPLINQLWLRSIKFAKPMFHSWLKSTLIYGISFKIPKRTLALKQIILKVSLILSNIPNQQFPQPMFLRILIKLSLIAHCLILRLISTLQKAIPPKQPPKLIPISKPKLPLSLLHHFVHFALIITTISIVYDALDELTILECSWEDAFLLWPFALTMGFVVF